jgi:hypothetical protein
VQAYSEHINHYLKDDADVAELMPFNPDSEELFAKVGDGIVLCKLINLACPGTIDKRAIVVKRPINIFNMNVLYSLGNMYLFLDQLEPGYPVCQIHRLCRRQHQTRPHHG